ncbi:hypothetical protein, partial [Mesorhizobium sp.]|uniref:hypothetical protein n=1 Tax=Mesorhizobium sp. TaxID=1871066 RepID=UPI0025C141F1
MTMDLRLAATTAARIARTAVAAMKAVASIGEVMVIGIVPSRGPRAVQSLIEPLPHPNFLFLRNSGRKTATHFS